MLYRALILWSLAPSAPGNLGLRVELGSFREIREGPPAHWRKGGSQGLWPDSQRGPLSFHPSGPGVLSPPHFPGSPSPGLSSSPGSWLCRSGLPCPWSPGFPMPQLLRLLITDSSAPPPRRSPPDPPIWGWQPAGLERGSGAVVALDACTPPNPPPVLRGPRFSVHCLAPGIRRQRLQGPGGQKLELGRRLSLGDGCGGERWFLALFAPGWAWRQRWGAGGGRRGHPGGGGGRRGHPHSLQRAFRLTRVRRVSGHRRRPRGPRFPRLGDPIPPGSRSPSDPAPPPSPSALNPAARNPASTRLLVPLDSDPGIPSAS